MLLAQVIPTHDRDLLLYAIAGLVLLAVGIVLIRFAARRRDDDR